MNLKKVDQFLQLQSQLISTYNEISVLSKKSPNETINKFKLKFINAQLNNINKFLGTAYLPFPHEFTCFDENDIPNNGDVVFILSHYLAALEKLRCDNIEEGSYGMWYWVIEGKQSEMQTSKPSIK